MLCSSLYGSTTFHNFADRYYYIGKERCIEIWNNPPKFDFEDIFHNTVDRCLHILDGKIMEKDEMKNYFFKAFRINMVRFYGYSYNAKRSGKEISDAVLEVSYENAIINHMDGFQMMDFIAKQFGKEMREVFWMHYNGKNILELEEIFGEKGLKYQICKIKSFLKHFYCPTSTRFIL